MKEQITSFDLEAAFKALDDLDIPVASHGIKANRPALTEIFSRKSKFDALFEEYYDISSTDELADAKATREAEVAKAKLARIEKIVDLDADSPEDLLTTYVGKYIIQCPQCMTLFYKNKEDVEESEDDATTVNVSEVCQHCGNESGYMLIGKVGEVSAEEATEEFGVDGETEEPLEATADDNGESETEADDIDSELSDDFDFEGELEDLDLSAEDTDESDKKEESHCAVHGGEPLTEKLYEAADLDISAEEFEELINSPEFKKPIADNDARGMLASLKDDNNDELTEATALDYDLDSVLDKIDDIMFWGKFSSTAGASWRTNIAPKVEVLDKHGYKVTHPKGGVYVVVKFDLTNVSDSVVNFTVDGKSFATKLVKEAQEMILAELDTKYRRQFDVVLDEGIFDKLKDKASGLIDSIASTLKSREAKADWVRENALEDYNSAQMDNKGRLVPDEKNQRFRAFIVVGFKDKYNNGKTITMAPSFNNQDLIIGHEPYVKKNYKDADNIAKGWSMQQGNGPAFIYLAKDKDDTKAVFLCQYFKGELENDQLDKYFKVVKDHLKGAKLMAQGNKNNDSASDEDENEETQNTGYVGKYEKTESLANVMVDVEELQESSIEHLISDSLVETYKNVAGFKLTDCNYLNEQLDVCGTIYFTSGNTRKTTYTFTEAYVKDNNKIRLCGLNEKLGTDKQFTLTGSIDNKTFITESFKCSK